MGYRVEYGPVRKVRGLEKRFSRTAALTGLCFLVFVVLVGALWPQGAEILRKLVFPGDPDVTAAAFAVFAEEVQNGSSISGSLREFCVRILEGAKLAAL